MPLPTQHEREELISEVRDLRSLAQTLRVDLERFEDPRFALVHAAKCLTRPARLRFRRTGSLILRATGLRKPSRDPSEFRPYQAKAMPPPQADRRRVLHAVANFRTGGSARLIVDLIEQLGDEYEQGVIVRQQPQVPAYEGVSVQAYPDLTTARPIQRLIGRFRPDLVHVHNVADHRREWSERDYRWYIHVFEAAEREGARVVENVNIATEPYRSTAVARYVYVSDYVRRRFALPGDATTVIYPGSDLAAFRPDGDRATDTIGLVYRLERDKLNEESLDPVVEALRRRERARAVVVGGGELQDHYERAAVAAGVRDRIAFTGYVAYGDLREWYRRMSVYVAPVHNESFGHVSVLAMGMELPVAGYDVGALREILGGTDHLAAPGDSHGLAEILVGLLDDPERARRIGTDNRRRAEQCFSVESMASAYRSLYEELVPVA